MKGSTLYRRMPDGTWSAQREDAPGEGGAGIAIAVADSPIADSPIAASPVAVPSAGVPGSVPARPTASAAGGPGTGTRAETHLAAEVAAVMSGVAVSQSEEAVPASAGAGQPQPAAPAPASPLGDVGAEASPAAPKPPISLVAPSVPPEQAPGPSPAARTLATSRGVARRMRRWNWKRIALGAAAAYVAWLVFLVLYAAFSLNKVPAAAPVPVADTPGTVWLMVGSDSREGLSKKERKELTTGGDVGQRTDTIMLLHMSGLGAPTLVSIPRDSWVDIPEYTTSAGRVIPAHQAKVNAAFAEGGPPLLNQTLQQATGLHIDHYAEVGFAGIVGLTNAVGGIDVCVDSDINDLKSGLKLKKGCHSLNGKQALAYVRMRYSDPRGDLGRIERQQEFVAKVMGGVLSWQTVVFPWRQWAIVNATLDAVAVDQQANLFNVGRLGLGLGQVAAGAGELTTVPTLDSDHWVDGQWVLRWDEAAATKLWQSLGAP